MQPQVAGSCALDAPYRPLAVPRTAVAIRLPKLWLAQCRCVASLARARVRSRWTGSEPWAVLLGKRLQGRDDLRSTAVGRRIIARFVRLQSTTAAGEEGPCAAGSRMRKRPSRSSCFFLHMKPQTSEIRGKVSPLPLQQARQ